jgi:hypothetical protein
MRDEPWLSSAEECANPAEIAKQPLPENVRTMYRIKTT